MHTLCALSVHQTHPVLEKKGTPATKSHDGGIHLIVPSHSQKVKSNAHPTLVSGFFCLHGRDGSRVPGSPRNAMANHIEAPGTRLPMFPKALAVHKQCHDYKLQQWSCEFVNPKQTTRTNFQPNNHKPRNKNTKHTQTNTKTTPTCKIAVRWDVEQRK